MSFTYPLALADFWEATFIGPAVMDLHQPKRKTTTRGGKVLTSFDGKARWVGSANYAPHNHRDSIAAEARLRRLGAGGTFLAYDLRAPYPAFDPDGSKLANGSLVAIGGEAAYGDVSLGSYRYEGSVVTLTQAASVAGDAGTYFDPDGVLQTASANVLRVDYGPYRNQIPNPKATGAAAGSPGTAPTGWTVSSGGGITRTIVGQSVEDGITYTNYRFQSAGANNVFVIPLTMTSVRAIAGMSMTFGIFARLVSGSLAGVTPQLDIQENDAAGAYLTDASLAISLTTSIQRFTQTRLLTNGSTRFVSATLRFIATGAYDFTIRVGQPTLEKATSALPFPRLPIGVLAETAFSNLLKQSRTFAHADWVKTRVGTPTLATVTDPWGGTAAYKIPEDATASNTHFIHQVYTTSNFVNHVCFFIARAEARSKILLQMSNFTSQACSAVFDLATGQTSNLTSGTTDFTGASARIIDLGNRWYWCELEALKVSGDNDCYPCLFILDDSGSNTYTGDGTSGIYLAQAQMEEGTLGHMPVVTTTAGLARAADALTFRAKGTNDWVYTMDDGSTGPAADVVGNWIPNVSALPRPRIKAWTATRDTQPSAAAPTIASVGADNTSIAINLPPFFKITTGDYISFPRSNGKKMLVQALEDAVANHLGVTAELQVQPPLRSGSLAGAAVTLVKASAEFQIPEGWTPPTGNGPISDGMAFAFEESL